MALGEVDYGLMGVVGGMVVYISYLNGLLSSAIGRFYALSVGKQKTDPVTGLEEGRMWFTTAVVIQSIIPIALIVVGCPIGEYAVNHWLTIPLDRVTACVWVWRFVCITCFLNMVTIPFTAMYGAHQYIAELTIYSFVTTTLNALFLHYMVTHPGIWLAKYAFWTCLLGVVPQLIITVRAYFLFKECRIDPKYFSCFSNVKKLASYGFWVMWGGLGAMLRGNGQNILINIYYGPRVNSGVAVGTSLSGHCNTLSGSMIGAFSPAIYNEWGAGNFDKARRLAYQICKLATLFVLVFAIPIILEVDEVLLLWLKKPPPYASGICIFVLVMNIIDKTSTGHLAVVNANGKIALYQAILGTSLVCTLPIGWLLIMLGVGPYSIGWAMVLTMIFCAFGRVWFARTLVGMSPRYWFKRIVIPIATIALLALLSGYLPRLFMVQSFMRVCVTSVLVEVLLIPFSWFLILEEPERAFLRKRIEPMFVKLRGRVHA